jgi:hypothetical protein
VSQPQIGPQIRPVDGGFLPNVVVSDIDLVLGNTSPTSGVVNESTGFNMLYATSFGRSAYAIRLNNSDVEQFRTVATFGPRVTEISPYTITGQTLQGINVTFDRDNPFQLLRIVLDPGSRLYPEISGSHYRCSIRFLKWQGVSTRPVQAEQDVPFLLTTCT